MEFIVNYWKEILAIVFVLGVAVFVIINQKNKLQSWLLYAVTEAESYFGSGTGQLKLMWVYDLFVDKFKWVSSFVPYSLFETMVDNALETMRDMLDKNDTIAEFVLLGGE